MIDDGLGAGSQHAPPAAAVEQRDTEASLELGQALAQRRPRHAERRSRFGPGAGLADGDQVLQLADGQVGKRLVGGVRHLDMIVKTSFTDASAASPSLIVVSMTARDIAPATGRLGVLTPGVGAVASTFIAGVIAARQGLKPPIGSITQMANIRLGKREENRNPLIREFVPIAQLDDLVFGGWDPLSSNVLEACETSGVLDGADLADISAELESIVPMEAVFDQRWVSRLDGVRVKDIANKWDQAMALMADIESFRTENDCDRLVMVWCGSTEAYQEPSAVHETVAAFEQGLKDNDDNISPSQIYAYAALQSDVPFANGAPNLSVDLPCMIELSETRGVPIAGKDFKTGQTLMKTMLAPGFKARMLGLRGWYSTNILGNRDGEVLDDPENFKSKEVSKLGVLDTILQPEVYPDLYGNIDHVVRINYYPPRGDNKEGWDAIDIFGWLGYPMQIKVDFLCRDSILAAPIVLDLALFMDLAHRAGESGVQEWLSFYLKAPQAAGDTPGRARPVHPADQAEEHPARMDGRTRRHPLRSRLMPARSGTRAGYLQARVPDLSGWRGFRCAALRCRASRVGAQVKKTSMMPGRSPWVGAG